MSTRFSAAVFDMDGTMVDTEPLHRQAWMSLLPEIGVAIDEAEYAATFSGRPGREIARNRLGLEGESAAVFATRVMDRFWELAPGRMMPATGLESVLDRMNGLPKAVATSARRVDAGRVLAGLGLADRFRAIVTIDDVLHGKPHPETFLRAADLLGVAAADCVAFEDSANGLRAAKAAGMFCVAIGPADFAGIADLLVSGFADPRLDELLATSLEMRS